jgi:hypothetical protein
MRWRKRKDSPVSSTYDNKSNKQNNPESPLSGEVYVSLPGHPLYGQKVRLTRYEPASRAHYCLIENPVYPDFQYQIKATWLSSSPPLPISATAFIQSSIWIDLPALDRMVSIILIHSENRRTSEDGRPIERDHPEDIGSTSAKEPPNTSRTPLLPGIATDRRHST